MRGGLGFVRGQRTRFINDFSQYPTGAPPDDWTQQWVTGGYSLSVESVTGSLSGKALRYSKTVFNRQATSWDKVPLITDGEVLMRSRAIAIPTTAKSIIGAVMRGSGNGTSTSNGYAGIAYTSPTGNRWSIQSNKWVAGTSSVVATGVGGPSPNYAVNVWFWSRFRCIGSSIRCKCWYATAVEPAAWANDLTDTSVTGAGWVGINNSDTEPTTEIDYFAVDISGASIPVPV